MNWNRVLIAGMGGFIGSALRYLISAAASARFERFPVGTLIVNIVGGLLMGFLMEICNDKFVSANLRIFMTTGVMGGLTTFSAFSYETVSLVSEGRCLEGGLNAGLNVTMALGACWVGRMAAKKMLRAA